MQLILFFFFWFSYGEVKQQLVYGISNKLLRGYEYILPFIFISPHSKDWPNHSGLFCCSFSLPYFKWCPHFSCG
jgi:hypothetical protein